MVNLIQILELSSDLENIIRTIEKNSGKPSQLVVKVGDDKYLVGDLRKRVGEYYLEMKDKYKPNLFKRKTVENPHKMLDGSYSSFDVLNKAVEKQEEVCLIGSPDHGYSVAIFGINLGCGGGQTYSSIGKIIFPLLQDGEKVSIEKSKY